jgi:hypothetical protein
MELRKEHSVTPRAALISRLNAGLPFTLQWREFSRSPFHDIFDDDAKGHSRQVTT